LGSVAKIKTILNVFLPLAHTDIRILKKGVNPMSIKIGKDGVFLHFGVK